MLSQDEPQLPHHRTTQQHPLATQERFHYYIAKTPDIAGQLAKNPNYTVKNVEYIQPGRRQFNTSLPKYADPRIRKAVAYAIDRDTLTKQIYQGAASPQTSDFLGELLDPSAEVYKYDPDMARKLLKDANWNTAQTVTFNDTAPVAGAAPNPIADAEFAAYQQWLGDIGMKVEQKLSPDSASFSDLTLKGDFECYENPHRRYDYYGPLEMKIYLLSTPRNYAVWKNADADKLVLEAIAQTDDQAYVATARKLSVLVAQECPYIPTKTPIWGMAAHKKFTGFTPIGEAYFAFTKPYLWDIAD